MKPRTKIMLYGLLTYPIIQLVFYILFYFVDIKYNWNIALTGYCLNLILVYILQVQIDGRIIELQDEIITDMVKSQK